MNAYSWHDITKGIHRLFPSALCSGTASLSEYDLILFGAGNAGQIALKELCQRDIGVAAFCDNDKSKWGTEVAGIPCCSPEELGRFKNPFVLVAPIAYYTEIANQLQSLGVAHVFADAISVFSNRHELQKIYDTYLSDDRSKHVFSALLLAKLYGSYAYSTEVYEDCFYYAPASFKFLNPFDVIVDCGAFVGDTIQEIIERRNGNGFTRIHAFEPGERQYKALTARVARLKEEWALADDQIQCVKAGLGVETQKAYLNIVDPRQLNISEISSDETENPIDIISLDEYFAEKDDKVSFIKADIEGSEMYMLQGAKNVIQKYKPNIALSLYHKWEDFFVIPQYIKSLVPEYKFYIRHHGHLLSETVGYFSVNNIV